MKFLIQVGREFYLRIVCSDSESNEPLPVDQIFSFIQPKIYKGSVTAVSVTLILDFSQSADNLVSSLCYSLPNIKRKYCMESNI